MLPNSLFTWLPYSIPCMVNLVEDLSNSYYTLEILRLGPESPLYVNYVTLVIYNIDIYLPIINKNKYDTRRTRISTVNSLLVPCYEIGKIRQEMLSII